MAQIANEMPPEEASPEPEALMPIDQQTPMPPDPTEEE